MNSERNYLSSEQKKWLKRFRTSPHCTMGDRELITLILTKGYYNNMSRGYLNKLRESYLQWLEEEKGLSSTELISLLYR